MFCGTLKKTTETHANQVGIAAPFSAHPHLAAFAVS